MAEEKMELRLINPLESEFLQHIDWNMDEIKAQVAAMMESYTDMVYTPDTMKLAKEDRAKLNKFVKIIEDKRKEIKKKWLEPYTRFEGEIKSVLELIQEPIKMIDGQIKGYENQQKEEKRQRLQEVYQENIGNLGDILPFEKIFDQRYLNATYDFDKAAGEIQASIKKVETDLATRDSLDSKDKLNVKDERLNQKDAAIAELKTTIEEMRASRLIELEESGNIAEAALRINGIFEAAQRCAEQYLLNVKRLSKNAFEKVTQEERMELPGESLMPEEIEEHGQLAVPEQRPVPRAFTITDRRGTRGQRISYESGWKTAARRKKLHG